MVTVKTKLTVFQHKILNNILFVNKMLFKLRKVESSLCFFCKAEDKTFLHLFDRCWKTCEKTILWRQLREFFSTALDLPSISPKSAIFGFLDALEHKLLINQILLILKNYLHEANLKDNDKHNKKWRVISSMLCLTKNQLKQKVVKRCYNW